ncbi:MAG: hypothetical protein LJE70_17935, partial [Chromatiaceae bacterium]|nr:hypothetical protein [Chromatiaceae bacterium]
MNTAKASHGAAYIAVDTDRIPGNSKPLGAMRDRLRRKHRRRSALQQDPTPPPPRISCAAHREEGDIRGRYRRAG